MTVSQANVLQYIASYPDLVAAFGTNGEAALNHYQNFGAAEGRRILFDGFEYIASYSDLSIALPLNGEDGARHFIQFGRNEGRKIGFDGLAYVASYADLSAKLGTSSEAGSRHFAQVGRNEGRSISFDPLAYIASYSDLRVKIGADSDAGARHFIIAGRNENRSVTFDPYNYLATYDDLRVAFGSDIVKGTSHFIRSGASEGRQGTFDGLAYIASYADLISAFGLNSAAGTKHFVQHGNAERRTVSFDAESYINRYSDLQMAFGSDLAAATKHFITNGFREGRDGSADSAFPGVSLSSSVNLGTLTATQNAAGNLTSGSDYDVFRFSLVGNAELSIDPTSGARTDIVVVQDKNGNRRIESGEVAQGIASLPSDASIFANILESGEYFLLVRSSGQPSSYTVKLSQVSLFGPIPEEDDDVVLQASATGFQSLSFNPVGSDVTFTSSAPFDTDTSGYQLFVNDVPVAQAGQYIHFNADQRSVVLKDFPYQEGLSKFTLLAEAADGRMITSSGEIWVGDETLTIAALKPGGAPAAGAKVVISSLEDQSISVAGVADANGQVKLGNLPVSNLLISAIDAQNNFSTLGVLGNEGAVTLQLNALGAPSPIDNNDFANGTFDGWTTSSGGAATIVSGPAPSASNTAFPPSFTADNAPANDFDFLWTVTDEGEATTTRTFSAEPGAETASISFRFITAEVPGGYFGTQFNDYYSVTLRTASGAVATDASNMNALGLGAFNAAGETSFRTLTVPVSTPGETVSVIVTVANQNDSQFDSSIQIDKVDQGSLKISSLSLLDLNNTKLQHLSVDSENLIFGGNTRIKGKVEFTGSEDDRLKSVTLEIVQSGKVTEVELAPVAEAALLNKDFGTDKKISISQPSLLFELSNEKAAGIDFSENGTLELRLKAETEDGDVAVKVFGSVDILTQYEPAQRYGGVDTAEGGDQWIKPDVIPLLDHFSDLTYGDLSNMNGGHFISHQTHRTGISIDAWFDGYNARNAATATKMLSYLNDPTYGDDILAVYVTYSAATTPAFYNAIKDVTLADGRAALDVIQNVGGHTTHFHWEVRASPTGGAASNSQPEVFSLALTDGRATNVADAPWSNVDATAVQYADAIWPARTPMFYADFPATMMV